jgi:plasmid stability protein
MAPRASTPWRSIGWTGPRVSIRSGLVRPTCRIPFGRVTVVHEASQGLVTMTAFQGAIFDVDGVLVDSPHELAWREVFRTLMEGDWRDVREQTRWTPEAFTPAVYQQLVAGVPRMASARAAMEHFDVPDIDARIEQYAGPDDPRARQGCRASPPHDRDRQRRQRRGRCRPWLVADRDAPVRQAEVRAAVVSPPAPGPGAALRPPSMCTRCQANRVAWSSARVDYCYACLPGGPFTPPRCVKCGTTEGYFSQGLCAGCHPGSPQQPGSCKGCLAWGVLRRYNWMCWSCRWWRTHYPEGACDYCGQLARIGEQRSTAVSGTGPDGARTRPRAHRRNPCSIAKWRSERHNGAMPSVQIKDVPEHTHAVLRQRAATAHQSLQEYLRTKLIQEASAPTVEEVLDRAGGRAGGRVPIKTATEILREDRDRR